MMFRSADGSSRDSNNRAFFDRWASSYEAGRIAPWFRYTQELAIRALDLGPGSRVLDVGCGTGHATRRLAAIVPVGRACGIDISARMIEQARARVPDELADRIEFREAAADAIPYGEGEFSHVLCTNSFHHYPDPIRSLREMRRVLEPGGQVAILENAPDLSWYTWAWDRILRIVEAGHVRYYPSRELGEMLERAGFEDRALLLLKNEFWKHGKLFASIQLWCARNPR
jgi:ubiquinone/menaquinone biosynthesis C-methylase UbiE